MDCEICNNRENILLERVIKLSIEKEKLNIKINKLQKRNSELKILKSRFDKQEFKEKLPYHLKQISILTSSMYYDTLQERQDDIDFIELKLGQIIENFKKEVPND